MGNITKNTNSTNKTYHKLIAFKQRSKKKKPIRKTKKITVKDSKQIMQNQKYTLSFPRMTQIQSFSPVP